MNPQITDWYTEQLRELEKLFIRTIAHKDSNEKVDEELTRILLDTTVGNLENFPLIRDAWEKPIKAT